MDADILVVGAGIHGAAVAHAAARRGYRVRVIEQFGHPAEGTSGRSSKLIHGGLRYLETGQIRLVRECLHEQRALLRERPALVKLVPFYLPVYRHTSRPAWKIAVGLWLYRLLGGHRFRRLPASEWQALDGLDARDLRAVFRYFDAQTDDRALTAAVLADAQALGAGVAFDTCLEGITCEASRCVVHCRGPAGVEAVTAACVVNAAGPWVNRVLARATPRPAMLAIELVQGTHIIVAGELKQGIYYLEAPQDRRAVFAMPWKGRTLIGTTETPYRGDPADVHPLPSEQAYLLAVYNHYFHRGLELTDIEDSFAGLRVLPAGEGSAFTRPRETILHRDAAAPRLLSIYGGKLTSHAHTARQVMKRLAPLLPGG